MQYDNLNNYNRFHNNKDIKLFNDFLYMEEKKQMQQRNLFLHPPQENFRFITSNHMPNIIDRINRKLQLIRENYDRSSMLSTQLYWYEGLYSSLIENENRIFRINQSVLSIKNHTIKSLTQYDSERSLLETHGILMKDLAYASPGRYRDVRVRVGNHIPPNPSLVPSLMNELFDFIHTNENSEVITAAWAHICFESIHPFADGNGRTGRSLVNNIFNLPIPLSRYIWNTRNNYYNVLDKADWSNYFEYFLTVLDETLSFTYKTLIGDN